MVFNGLRPSLVDAEIPMAGVAVNMKWMMVSCCLLRSRFDWFTRLRWRPFDPTTSATSPNFRFWVASPSLPLAPQNPTFFRFRLVYNKCWKLKLQTTGAAAQPPIPSHLTTPTKQTSCYSTCEIIQGHLKGRDRGSRYLLLPSRFPNLGEHLVAKCHSTEASKKLWRGRLDSHKSHKHHPDTSRMNRMQ